jgi:limonene-1,2-epoxide hydrolase
LDLYRLRLPNQGGDMTVHEPTRNLEVLFDWIDAMRRRDVDRVVDLFSADVRWEGVAADVACHGRDAVLDMFAEVFRSRDGYTVEGIELRASAHRVVLGVRDPERVEIGGIELHGQLFTVFTLEEGRIVHARDFARREDAFRAAGLDATWR